VGATTLSPLGLDGGAFEVALVRARWTGRFPEGCCGSSHIGKLAQPREQIKNMRIARKRTPPAWYVVLGERAGLEMLSVVIATENSERVLVPTLTALVPGATAGIISEVIIADAGSSDATRIIADSAGCRISVKQEPLGERLRQAAAGARSPWLLFLRPNIVLESSWVDETARFIQHAELGVRSDGRAATFRPPGAADTFVATLREGFGLIAAAIGARSHARQGLLISKALYERLGGHRGGDADPEKSLLRRLGRGRIVMLRSRTLLAGD
jgi:hypothetical protein